jgi:DNA-directed RNA polymerase specialized sigma24 family protein
MNTLREDAIFSEFDYAVVRLALAKLSKRQRWIVRRRFWDCWPLVQIADELRASYKFVEDELESAFRNLRVLCMATPKFSRARQACNSMEYSRAA